LEGDIVIPENTSEWLKKEKVRKTSEIPTKAV
jgi:hypothetical protein